ncbi:MAG: hypothetical protein ACTSRW_08335 [Candidatus Helarchaeota archaeon]
MIHGIYVFRPGGICLFYKSFDKYQEDPHAICAFLSAISTFSETTFGEKLKSITTSRHRLLIYREREGNEKLTFVYILDLTDKTPNFTKINDSFRGRFFQHFSKALPTCLENNTLLPDLPQFENNLNEIFVRC